MAGKIFINYRRDDSIGMAGRLHDRLVQIFGRDKLFLDVDHIPAGADFVAHLDSQVAECDVVLVVIGLGWLGAKDESGGRRLDNPDDFVAIEIAAALGRGILIIPVLVDGARMPKASELPDSLKLLARRQAVEVRHANFGHDAEALIAKMHQALGGNVAGRGRWRLRVAIGAAAVAVLLLIGWGGYALMDQMTPGKQAAQSREAEPKSESALQHEATATNEADAKPGPSFRDRLVDGQPCAACPEMVTVPAGALMMGSPDTERGRSAEEGPQHRVTIAKPLAVGKFPVTRAEFAVFVEETGYKAGESCDVWNGVEWRNQPDHSWQTLSFLGQSDQHPVVCITWYDAKEFAAWLSKKVGKPYRLLTEAEREYATRAKTATRYSFGDDEGWLPDYAWYEPNSRGVTHAVGEKKPNAFGLFDMHGNVWGWCEDVWHPHYLGAPGDGSAWQAGDTPYRVLRGGSWFRNANGVRSAFRIGLSPDGRYTDVGFRVARGL